jgi:adenylate kinase family enzyme
MQRIVIVGTTGSGKTTLGQRLATQTGYLLVDLDAIHWGPDWTPMPLDQFRARVSEALAGPCWVVAGNYGKVRDIVWARADTLVWLDYPLALTLTRLFRRTVQRIVTREELWSGNRETWRVQFASRDSLFLWALKTHRRYREMITTNLTVPEYAHLKVLRFHQPDEAEAWLRNLERSA